MIGAAALFLSPILFSVPTLLLGPTLFLGPTLSLGPGPGGPLGLGRAPYSASMASDAEALTAAHEGSVIGNKYGKSY